MQTTCEAFNEGADVCNDLKVGCTGKIKTGDTIVRSWALKEHPKGLHARCAKRMHEALVSIKLCGVVFSNFFFAGFFVQHYVFVALDYTDVFICFFPQIISLFTMLRSVVIRHNCTSSHNTAFPTVSLFVHESQIAQIIAEKKFHQTSGTTAEDEAKAPSAVLTDDLDDF